MDKPKEEIETLNSNSPSDQEFILKAREGCKDSFGQLVTRYGDQLVSYLCRRLGSQHQAEDIAQESFVRAYQKLNSYSEKYSFSTWLFTIARNLSNDLYRSKKPNIMVLNTHHADTLEDSSKGEPDQIFLEKERQLTMWKIARELPSHYFELIQLFYAEDKSISEISQIVGKTKTTVKVTLSRARRALKKRVERYENEALIQQTSLVSILHKR